MTLDISAEISSDQLHLIDGFEEIVLLCRLLSVFHSVVGNEIL